MSRIWRIIYALDTRLAERRVLPIVMAFAAGVLLHDLAVEADGARQAARADAAEMQLFAARAALARRDAEHSGGGITYADAAALCPHIAATGDRHE